MAVPVIHSARLSGSSSSAGLRRSTWAVWLLCMLPDIPAVTVNFPGPSCTLTWRLYSREEKLRDHTLPSESTVARLSGWRL